MFVVEDTTSYCLRVCASDLRSSDLLYSLMNGLSSHVSLERLFPACLRWSSLPVFITCFSCHFQSDSLTNVFVHYLSSQLE